MSSETHREKHIEELLPAYALGCLEQEDELLVAEHLAHCAVCRAELESYRSVVDKLPLAAPTSGPPSELKGRLMDRVQPARARADQAGQPAWWQRLVNLLQRSAPVWGLASLILIVALGINNLTLREQAREAQMDTSPMRVVRLQGTEAAPNATGTLVLSVDGEHGTLVVDGLPVLDEAHAYQLWLIKDGQRTSGGLLSVNRRGYGALWVSSPEPLDSYPDFGMTIEPAGGSPGPTGDKVLGGSL